MSYQALARKWRPQRFEDVVGQRGTVETLKNAIASGRIAQAFIFAGPRGVGKTTTARIVARALNCVDGPTTEPCGRCDACLEIAEGRDVDVLEIDGATYTGVDAVREVIVEPLAIAPMRDRFKIFIIDEVHRLSKAAFDALLKSIEEPPPYVKFMMATTELLHVPVTIQSRAQVFDLKALPFAVIRTQLRAITDRESVRIDDQALALLARSAEGSMRDALSALDQVLAFTADQVTAADVSTVLGLISRDLQFEIVETVAEEDLAGAFRIAGTVVEQGFDLRIVCRELARLMRDVLVVSIDPTRLSDPEIASEGEQDRLRRLAERYSREDLMRAFDLLSRAEFEIRGASQPRHHFEMALVKWIHLRRLTPLTELIASGGAAGGLKAAPPSAAPTPRRTPEVSKVAPSQPAATHAPVPAPVRPAAPAAPVRAAAPSHADVASAEFLTAFQASIREQANKSFFSMVVAQATLLVEGDSIVFVFQPVHRTLRAQLEGKKAWLEQLAHSVAGRKMTVVARESAPVPPPPAAEDTANGRRDDLRARAKAGPAVQAVLDVFGGEIEDVEELD